MRTIELISVPFQEFLVQYVLHLQIDFYIRIVVHCIFFNGFFIRACTSVSSTTPEMYSTKTWNGAVLKVLQMNFKQQLNGGITKLRQNLDYIIEDITKSR